MSTLVCIAKTEEKAQEIVNHLRQSGFSAKETSILFSASKELMELEKDHGAKKAAGAVSGLGLGAITGGLTGLLLALTVFDVPEVGVLVALGPIVVHIADALAGIASGAAGAIAGALTGLRLPDHSARFYERALNEGNILITVQVDDSGKRAIAKSVFEKNGGEDIAVVE